MDTAPNLAEALLSRKPAAPILGSFVCSAPENWLPLQALLPTKDTWPAGQIEAAVAFGRELAEKLGGGKLVSCGLVPKPRGSDGLAVWAIKKVAGMPRIDPVKCRHCGCCVDSCPYNAIIFDVEDTIPRFDPSRCRGCGRCFNVCPGRAVEFPRLHTALRSQVRDVKPAVVGSRDEDGLTWAAPTQLQMWKRPFAGCGWMLRWLLGAVVAVAFVVVMVWRW